MIPTGYRHVPLVLLQVLVSSLISGATVAAEPLVPLTELGKAEYRGEQGGLYGEGQNEPPAAHRRLAEKALAKIQPLNTLGKPAADGKIVLLSIGMSNTTQEFSAFVPLVKQHRHVRPELVLVDGAQGGADAALWAGDPSGKRPAKADPWRIAQARLQAVEATTDQVQAVWIKQALAGPARYGEFPGSVDALESALAKIVRRSRAEFPNLQVVFLSSRIYAGYATTKLNPEPYAYESALAVRQLIARQTEGDAELNCDSTRGELQAPLLLWGPYLWGDGKTPRKADGLVWRREDFQGDGTHPSDAGRRKVAELLLKFFTEDDFGRKVVLR